MRLIITLSGNIPDDLNKEQIHWIRADAKYWTKELSAYAHDVGIAVEFLEKESKEILQKGFLPSSVIEVPEKLTQDEYQRIREKWRIMCGGKPYENKSKLTMVRQIIYTITVLMIGISLGVAW